MKIFLALFLILINFSLVKSQYTETINSNRPGLSQGAFSVGKDVLQFELGFRNTNSKNQSFNDSKISSIKYLYNIRYGFLSNKLEVFLEGSYNNDEVDDLVESVNYNNYFFGKQTLGLKFLVFDPFKNKKWHNVNLLSWKKNRNLKLVDFIPAISIITGINHMPRNGNDFDDPFYVFNKKSLFEINEKSINTKVGLITQNHFLGKWVFVNNLTFDRLGTSYLILNYTTTLTHNFKNPRWSSFIEYELIKNDIYSNNFFNIGTAFLFNQDLQVDTSFGINSKKTPSNINFNLGISTRLDWYEDELPINKKERKSQRKERKKTGEKIKKDLKLEKKQKKINIKFDRKENRLIKKNNRKNKK